MEAVKEASASGRPAVTIPALPGSVDDTKDYQGMLTDGVGGGGSLSSADRKPPSSKYIGVTWCRLNDKWKTQIGHNGKTRFVGNYDNEEAAAKAYDAAVKSLIWEEELARQSQKRENEGKGSANGAMKRKRSSSQTDIESDEMEAAVREFHGRGFTVIEQAIPLAWIEAAHKRIDSLGVRVQYGGLRAELNFSLDDAPFKSPDLIDNPRISPLLERLLGPSRKIQRIGGIVSFPEADDQEIHRVSSTKK
jgi:hypothetical protein